MTDHPQPVRGAPVSLREITADTVRIVCRLKVKPEQESYVAPNATSIAEAHFQPKAWFRAIYADEVPVGFVMLYDDPDAPNYYLWRYMIDARYQGMGFGEAALVQLIDHVKARPGATELLLSYCPGPYSPRDFYARLGFAETGKEEHGQREMRLDLR